MKPYNRSVFEYTPVIIVGFICDVDKYFIEWLCFMCEEFNIDVDNDNFSMWNAFREICEKKKINTELFYFTGIESIVLNEDECVVGVLLDSVDERLSLKRIKIDVYNILVDIDFISPEDTTLEMIDIFNDIIWYNKEKKDDKECVKCKK